MRKILSCCKKPYAVCVLFVLVLGALNLWIQCGPGIRENSREREAVKTFDKFWESEGAQRFRDVGVEPTEKIRQEELESYLKKFHEAHPTLIPEKRILQMKESFQTWWETTGKKSYAASEIAPDEKLYKSELNRYVRAYTETLPEYRIFYIPEESGFWHLFTCWILFPGTPSFLIFAAGFLLAMKVLDCRRGLLQPTILFAASLPISGILFALSLSLTYFARESGTPYTGTSLALALLLGFAAFDKKSFPVPTAISCSATALLLADALVNWFVCPNLYGWVAILEVPLFGVGALLGVKMPHHSPKRARKADNETVMRADPGKKLRESLKDAIELANKAEYDHASEILSQDFGRLLSERPLDRECIEKTLESMLYPRFFFTIPSILWSSWAAEADKKGLPEVAVKLYEKSLSLETDEKARRRNLFYAGDLRLRHHIDREKGEEELKAVIDSGSPDDILTNEARKWLGN